MALFGEKKKPKKKPDRRAGKVPHVGKSPRTRNKDGSWRKKSATAGKKRPKKKSLLKKLLG